MLAAVLPKAFALGIDPVILIYAETNTASRTVIERNGGHLAAVLDGHLPHHIGQPAPPPPCRLS